MVRILLLLLLFSVKSFAQANLDKGLVAYYPFNGNTNDESGNLNNPILVKNLSLAEGRAGKKNTAYYFNGKNSFIQVKNNASLTPGEMTLVAIVKPMGFYMGNCYNNSIIDKGAWDYQSGVYALRYTAGEYTKGDCAQPALAYQNFVGSANTNAGATSKDQRVKLNTWYCLVFTVSKNNLKLYVNGKLVSTEYKNIDIGKNAEDLFIGKKNNSQYPYWFNGVMDEIRIYNRPLNQDEITTLCANPSLVTAPDLTCAPANKASAKFTHTISNCNTVTFNLAEANSKNFSRIQWTFGDGKTSDKKEPVHTYAKDGTYKVRAIVTSKSGCRDTVTKQIQLHPLSVDFTFTEEDQPGELSFKVKNNKAAYNWNFGDEQTSQDHSLITHHYTASGKYTVTLFARSSEGCTDTVQKEIEVLLPEPNVVPVTAPAETPAVPEPTPAETPALEKRTRDVVKTIVVENDSITVSLYDNGMIDGDSITLVYNNNVILTHQLLKSKPLTLRLKIEPARSSNELVMYAENLGSIPPNTALMIIYDGDKRYEVSVSSTRQSNGVISFTPRR